MKNLNKGIFAYSLAFVLAFFSSSPTIYAQASKTWSQANITNVNDVTGSIERGLLPPWIFFVTRADGTIWRTDNEGASFYPIKNQPYSPNYNACCFTRVSLGYNGTLWAVDISGFLWKYALAGNWEKKTRSELCDPDEICSVVDVGASQDSNFIAVVLQDGYVKRSFDGGITFSPKILSGCCFNRVTTGDKDLLVSSFGNTSIWGYKYYWDNSWIYLGLGAGDLALGADNNLYTVKPGGLIGIRDHINEYGFTLSPFCCFTNVSTFDYGGVLAVRRDRTLWKFNW